MSINLVDDSFNQAGHVLLVITFFLREIPSGFHRPLPTPVFPLHRTITVYYDPIGIERTSS